MINKWTTLNLRSQKNKNVLKTEQVLLYIDMKCPDPVLLNNL